MSDVNKAFVLFVLQEEDRIRHLNLSKFYKITDDSPLSIPKIEETGGQIANNFAASKVLVRLAADEA